MIAWLHRHRRPVAALMLILVIAIVYRAFFEGEVLAGRDGYRLFIPNAAFLLECLRRHVLPLWDPYARLGHPFAATIQAQAFYPPNLLAVLLVGPVWTPSVLQLFDVALGAAGTFFTCRKLRCSFWASGIGATVFALTPFFIQAGFDPNIACATAWTGWICGIAISLGRRPTWRTTALLGCTLALSVLCGAPLVTLIQSGLALICCLAVARRKRSAALRIVGGCAWGFAMAAVVLLPALELTRHSIRRADPSHALQWSTSIPQLISIFFPFAEQPRSAYWGGDQWLFFSLFLGSAALILSALGAWRWRGRKGWFLGPAALLFLLLAMGRHFPPSAWLLSHPPLSVFRYPAKYFVGAAFCIALLSALGFDRLALLARRLSPSPRRAVALVLGSTVIFFVGYPSLRHPPFRKLMPLSFAWALGIFFVAGLAFLLIPRGPSRPARVRFSLGAVVLAEAIILSFWSPTVGWFSPKGLTASSVLGRLVPKAYAGRVSVRLPILKEDADAAARDWYIDHLRAALVPLLPVMDGLSIFEGYGSLVPVRAAKLEKGAPKPTYDLAGVSYFVRASKPPLDGLQEVGRVPRIAELYHSTTALPHAFVVYRARKVTAKEAHRAISDPTEPFRTTAFLESGAELTPKPSSSCVGPTPARVDEGIDRVTVELDACAEGDLVLTDAFYPGWTATLDGKPVPIHRADWLMRAVRVPPGHHRIEMRYRPGSFVWGALISVSALVAALLVFIFGGLRRRSA